MHRNIKELESVKAYVQVVQSALILRYALHIIDRISRSNNKFSQANELSMPSNRWTLLC